MNLARPFHCAALLATLTLQGCKERPGASWPERECPEETSGASISRKANDDEVKLTTSITNKAGVDLELYWHEPEGNEVFLVTLVSGKNATQGSYAGHVLLARSQKTAKLVARLRVMPPDELHFVVTPCTGMERSLDDELDRSRWPEFQRLAAVVAKTPCEGPSGQWSCARTVGPEEVKARDSALYGFTADEAATKGNPYKAGTTIDHIHDPQMRYIPNVTEYDGGYLRIQMTDKIKKLLPYYHKHRSKTHEAVFIPGYFTNNHIVKMQMLDIPSRLMQEVQDEMHQVMEWWTKKRLRHTTTFGIRIYRREAMLINHLDRKETHLASAILQVHQVCDEGGGWPVEVVHPHRAGITEVYLQPGEMLLYEGARLPHGRPMRFRGEEFANVFSHFVPADFRGPNSRWKNPHLDPEKKKKAEL